MSVHSIESSDDFKTQLQSAKDSLVIVDFYADWCGPCKNIAPYVAELAEKHPDVKFLKVNVDKNRDVMTSEGVMSLPTFIAYKNNEKKSKFTGADRARLDDLIANDGVSTLPEQSAVDYPRLAMFVVLIIYMLYKNGYLAFLGF